MAAAPLWTRCPRAEHPSDMTHEGDHRCHHPQHEQYEGEQQRHTREHIYIYTYIEHVRTYEYTNISMFFERSDTVANKIELN